MPTPGSLPPGVQRLAVRTPTLPPATHTNSYALGEREVLLVEPSTPYEDEQRRWLEWAEGMQSQGRTVVGIFVTHHHSDHTGGAEVLCKALGVPLWGHRETEVRMNVPLGRRLEQGQTLPLQGPVAQQWRVLHTPGHAPGHLCLHEPQLGAVVAGDMVASQGTILIEPGDGDMTAYLEQLRRLAKLDARVALPAHGDPIGDPSRLFRAYILHREMRESKVLSALRSISDVGGTPRDILPLAYDDTPKAAWPLAVLSVQAHLDKLVRDGKVRVREGSYALDRSGGEA